MRSCTLSLLFTNCPGMVHASSMHANFTPLMHPLLKVVDAQGRPVSNSKGDAATVQAAYHKAIQERRTFELRVTYLRDGPNGRRWGHERPRDSLEVLQLQQQEEHRRRRSGQYQYQQLSGQQQQQSAHSGQLPPPLPPQKQQQQQQQQSAHSGQLPPPLSSQLQQQQLDHHPQHQHQQQSAEHQHYWQLGTPVSAGHHSSSSWAVTSSNASSIIVQPLGLLHFRHANTFSYDLSADLKLQEQRHATTCGPPEGPPCFYFATLREFAATFGVSGYGFGSSNPGSANPPGSAQLPSNFSLASGGEAAGSWSWDRSNLDSAGAFGFTPVAAAAHAHALARPPQTPAGQSIGSAVSGALSSGMFAYRGPSSDGAGPGALLPEDEAFSDIKLGSLLGKGSFGRVYRGAGG